MDLRNGETTRPGLFQYSLIYFYADSNNAIGYMISYRSQTISQQQRSLTPKVIADTLTVTVYKL